MAEDEEPVDVEDMAADVGTAGVMVIGCADCSVDGATGLTMVVCVVITTKDHVNGCTQGRKIYSSYQSWTKGNVKSQRW